MMLLIRKKSFRNAVIETAAIAIGVFLALLADNWNEDRKDQQLEQQFLQGISLDLKLNNDEITNLKTVAADLRGSLERIIQAIKTGEDTWNSPESFILDLVQCTYLGIPTLSSVAFDELQSTGSMRLIRDTKFKRKLANYYADFLSQSQFHPEYRRKEAALEEALLGFLPLADRIQISDLLEAEDSMIDVAQTINALQQVPDLLFRLEDMVWVQHRIQTRYERVIENGNELLAHIEMMR